MSQRARPAGRITHFELYGDQPEVLAEFYRRTLGWSIERAEGVDYWRVAFGPEPASVGGGGLARPPGFAHQGWLPYFEVPVLDDVVALAVSLGGQVVRERSAVPRTAWYAVLADPAGNNFAVWQSDLKAMPLPEPD